MNSSIIWKILAVLAWGIELAMMVYLIVRSYTLHIVY